MLLWPRLVYGNTTVPRSSPGPRIPSGCRPLVAPGALLISPFNVKWRFSVPAGGVEGSNYAFSQWLCLQSMSPASLQDFTIGSSLSASYLYPPSWNPWPLSHSWLLGMCHLSCLLYLACEGCPLPPLRHSGHPTLFATCLFRCYRLLFSFFSFFPGGGRSIQGAMLIWPRVVCGSTAYCLADFVVCIFPSCLGSAVWQQLRSSPAFSV
jgi:hypothetical protein